MTRLVSSAYREHPDGRHELVGTFLPRELDDGQRYIRVTEPLLPPTFTPGPPLAVRDMIRSHPFPVVWMRDDHGARFLALRVAPGDPVTWLRGWAWQDPRMAARWRPGGGE